jgi:S-adenosylmethionine hydrolase
MKLGSHREVIIVACLWLQASIAFASEPLVLQSDFGVKDIAVASMKGVAVGVSRDLDIYDLTHEIPTFNIWEASLRLEQAAEYWPKGTVFVSVVDPGVGTARRSVVLKTKSGQYFVSPDNGSLTAVAERFGIAAVREIDEAVNRLANSEKSFSFEEVGQELPDTVTMIAYQKPEFDGQRIVGNVEILDPQYGNIWTNIDRDTFEKMELAVGDLISVRISNNGKTVYEQTMPYFESFGRVEIGAPLLYLNSINDVALALNQGNFSSEFHILSGPDWGIEISQAEK